MLKSMTGFGDARHLCDPLHVSVEVRSVNNKFLKVSVKLPDAYARMEADIERTVRQRLSRGTVSVSVRVKRVGSADGYRLNEEVIAGYLAQLESFGGGVAQLAAVLGLPGCVEESKDELDLEADWPVIQGVVDAAITGLNTMRAREGEAMREVLDSYCRDMSDLIRRIDDKAPSVVGQCRDRLTDRVNELLKKHGVTIEPSDLVREMAIFAERTDAAEETNRLRSHVDQFRSLMTSAEACGRKLEFIGQEMFRECNTIGAKSGDAEISAWVVELKSIVDRIRELTANVE